MGEVRITQVDLVDVRFPTSVTLDGSDAMNRAPDYSAAYLILRTSQPGLEGWGFAFTIGRGNELCIAALAALRPILLGLSLDEIQNDFGRVWRRLVGDSQLRWVGPEKGVIHLAAAAAANALWDLWARFVGKPVWQLVAGLSPEQVVSTLDLRHVADVLPREEALGLLREGREGIAAREASLRGEGFPAYTTSAGWLGYSEAQIARLAAEAIGTGWSALKIKVGGDHDADLRRCAIVREIVGPDVRLMLDANQVWEIDEAITRLRDLAAFDPYWIEEPVAPDDVLGHARVARTVRPIRVATGEHVPNRVMFKQFLQADAIDIVQVDACRVGGLNEAIVVMLLAKTFGKPVCPHAGGVGLCENAQHVSMIDYLCIGGSRDGRMTEHAGHLHEHFVDPIRIANGAYVAPTLPGFSAEIHASSLAEFAYPHGSYWKLAAA
jgi:L-fuconate dehydratase